MPRTRPPFRYSRIRNAVRVLRQSLHRRPTRPRVLPQLAARPSPPADRIGRREIITQFFDIGLSRSLPWSRRPEAARLLHTLPNPDRAFGAVVIGEPQRAFYGNQFGLTFPVSVHYRVGLWVPEVGGAVDPGSDAHDLMMSLYGGISKGERNRIKTRVRSAMAAQAAIEGRFLGGRPPYGYRLIDGGPHPIPAKAASGQRLHRLEPDPVAAPVVQRIFSEFLAGRGLYAIAEGLTHDGILSPSAHDPDRNRHRRGLWRGVVKGGRASHPAQPPLHRPPGVEPSAPGGGPSHA